MKKTPRRALLDDAGRLYILKKQLVELERERDGLNDRIVRLERQVAQAQADFDTSYERVAGLGANGDVVADTTASAAEYLTPGKLPQRIFDRMKCAPSRIYTAADLTADLKIGDVQQVRTALARLVEKGLVRRTGVKGEFTI